MTLIKYPRFPPISLSWCFFLAIGCWQVSLPSCWRALLPLAIIEWLSVPSSAEVARMTSSP
jgi:hypothetical protein